jgi:hypothetical protein
MNYSPIYEWYKFHGATFIFQSNQPTTAAGEVIVCIDYDDTDTPPSSSTGMMRNISSTMANIYSDASLGLVGSLSRLPKYETTPSPSATLQAGQGACYVAVEGVTGTAGAIVGYLIAEYDIEFFTPQ